MAEPKPSSLENSINRYALQAELPTIQSKTIENFGPQLEARLSFIESELKKPNLTPDEKRFYQQYIQAVSDLETRYNWTDTTKNSLKSLLEQIQISQNKTFLTTLKDKIDTGLENMEVNNLINVTNDVNIYVAEEMKKHPEKASGLKGTAGWLLLTRLEESGFYPRIVLESTPSSTKKHIIRVDTKNKTDQSKATAIANALNNQFSDVRDGLEYALMWKSSEFGNFTQSSLGADGKINPKADLSYGKYVQDAQKKGLLKSDADRAFLDSLGQMPSASNPESMKQAITGYIQFQESIAGIQKKLQNDPKAKKELEKAAKNGQEKSTSVPSSSETSTRMTAKMTSEVDGKTGQSIGNFVGKAARGSVSGLFGGMGDLLKMGGGDPIATLVIGGGLLYGIYQAFKKFGFFGGIGALLGFGAVNNAEAIFGKDKASKGAEEKPADTSTKPPTPGVPGGASSESRNEVAPQNNLTPEQAFHANLLMLPANTNTENLREKMTPIDTFANVPFSLLQNALAQKGGTDAQKSAWDAVRSSVNYDSMSDAEKKKFDTAINPENINAVNQYVVSLSKKEEAKKTLAKLPNITLENLANAIQRDEKKQAPRLGEPAPKELYTLSETHGDLWLIWKLISTGYVPQIRTISAETKGIEKGLYYWTGMQLNPIWHKMDANYSPAKWNTATRNYINGLLGESVKKETDIMNMPELKPKTGTEFAAQFEAEKSKLDNLKDLMSSGKGPGSPEFDKVYKEYAEMTEKSTWKKAVGLVKYRDANKKWHEQVRGIGTKEKFIESEAERVQKAQAELARTANDIDTHAKSVTDAAEKWKGEKTEANRKALMDAMDAYNSKVTPLEQHLVNHASVLGEKEWKEVLRNNTKSSYLKEFYTKNIETIKKPIDWIKERPGKIANHWTGRTFIGIGMLSLMVDAATHKDKEGEKGFWDLANEGHFWQGAWKATRTYGIDIGLSMVPIYGTAHDLMIVNADWYRKIITGSDAELSEEEKSMRTMFAAVGVFGGAGVVIKFIGKGASKIPLIGAMPGAALQTVGGFAYGTSNFVRGTLVWVGAGYGIHRLYNSVTPQDN